MITNNTSRKIRLAALFLVLAISFGISNPDKADSQRYAAGSRHRNGTTYAHAHRTIPYSHHAESPARIPARTRPADLRGRDRVAILRDRVMG